MSPTKRQKAKTLPDVRAAAQISPLESEKDDWYVKELNDVRGRHVVDKMMIHLETPSDRGIHLAYCGHRGCGKTTELFLLADRLEEKKVLSVYCDADPDLMDEKLSFADIMLYLAQNALEKVHELYPDAINMDLLEPVKMWFQEKVTTVDNTLEGSVTLESGLSAETGIPWFTKLFATITGSVSTSSKRSNQMREILRERPSALVDHINQLFRVVKNALNNDRYSKMLLILDSLDRLHPDIIDRAFIQHARLFRKLNIDMVFTIPISMLYKPVGDCVEDTGFKTVCLPMVAVRRERDGWDRENEKHLAVLKKVVEQRVNVPFVFEDETILHQMVLDSGGSLRDLLRLLEKSAETRADMISMASYLEGRQDLILDFKRRLGPSDYPSLLDVHERKRVDGLEPDKKSDYLFYRYILEYNGKTWMDIHPFIYHNERFQDLLRKDG